MTQWKMKNSGIEWIGEIPEEWKIRKIKQLSPVLRGASPRPIDDEKYFDEKGSYVWTRIADISSCNKYFEKYDEYMSAFGVSKSIKREPGDLFVSICATIGKAIITKVKCCIHDGFVYFPELNKKYNELLYYIFENGYCFGGLGKLGTQLNLNTETVENISIPLMPDNELRSIINFLNSKCAVIDKTIEVEEQIIEKLKIYKQSVITDAVTKGLDKNAKMNPSGIDWMEEIPEGWEVAKVKKHFTIICGSTPKSDESKYWNGNINWITPAEMGVDNAIITDSVRKITKAGYESCGTTLVPVNSIILSTRAPIGQVCIAGRELCTNQGCKSLRVQDEATYYKYYFYYFLVQTGILNMLGRGTTFMELSTSDLANYVIPVPGVAEQKKIASYLDEKCKAIDNCIYNKTVLVEKIKVYKKSLIYECVTGKREIK